MDNSNSSQKKENININPSTQNITTRQELNKKLEALSNFPLLQELPFTYKSMLSQELVEEVYKKKEYIIKQGDPINKIYLSLQGPFILSINHQIKYDVQHDINTFINYQNITKEPFYSSREHEITGKINYNEEFELFIYEGFNFFGDIELAANLDKSLFNIRAGDDNSVICSVDKNYFMDIIQKVKITFKNNVEEKLDFIQERIKDILAKKIDLNFDKIKNYKNRISYQLSINHNYDLILQKLNKIKNNINNNNIHINKKSKNKFLKYNSKNRHINTKKLSLRNNNKDRFSHSHYNIKKSKSVANMVDEKKVMKLFEFPTVLKNDTKVMFDNFFEGIYNKYNIKNFNLNKIKLDYEPIYLTKFRNISKFSPQKKFEFLYHVKNHLTEQLKTPSTLVKKKANIRELVTLYNYYIINGNSTMSGFAPEGEKIKNRSYGILNPAIKDNLNKKSKNSSDIKQSFQGRKPIKLESIKFHNSLLDSYILSKNKNIDTKIKSNKFFFNSILSEEIKKNTFNISPKFNFFRPKNNNSSINNKSDINTKTNINNGTNFIIKEKENKKMIKKEEKSVQNLKGKRLSISLNLSNNTLYKNVRMESKNIFDILLKKKCEATKNKSLGIINNKSNFSHNNLDNILNINNNIDVKNEDYLKNFISKHHLFRANTFKLIK